MISHCFTNLCIHTTVQNFHKKREGQTCERGEVGKGGTGEERREERTGKDSSLLHELFSSGVPFDGFCICAYLCSSCVYTSSPDGDGKQQGECEEGKRERDKSVEREGGGWDRKGIPLIL